MKTIFICYGDEKFRSQQASIMSEAHTFDERVAYTEKDITRIYSKYKLAWDSVSNAGCIWKPYIILDALSLASYGDLVFYSDCGDFINNENNYAEFIKKNLKQDTFLVTSGYQNDTYTKEYCFQAMGCTDMCYRTGRHLEAGQVGFIKTDFNIRFVNEWFEYCKDLDILLDHDMGMKNANPKCRHSRDQSILTNLQIKYNIPTIHANKIVGNYIFFNASRG